MTNVSYPGVYMEEVSSGIRPIQAASTSTAAFFGVAERGPFDRVTQIFNFTEFQTTYGGFLTSGYLAHSVFQFFNNGGSKCYVGRVANSPITADVTINDRAPAPQTSMTIAASSAGGFGNRLQVTIDAANSVDPENTFDLSVHEFGTGLTEPMLLETFTGLTMDPADVAGYVENIVNSRSNYIRVETNAATTNEIAGFLEGTPLTGAGPFLGATERVLRISIDGDGFQDLDLTTALAAVDLTSPTDIAAAMEPAVQALVPLRTTTAATAYSAATVAAVGAGTNQIQITSGAASTGSSVEVRDGLDPTTTAAGQLGLLAGSRSVRGAADLRPPDTAPGAFYLLGDAIVAGAVTAVTAGDDGSTPQDLDYINAFNLLDAISDVSLIAVPGVGSEAIADAGMNYCFTRPLSDCFFIADMSITDSTLVDAQAWRDAINVPNSYGAVYFPWLRMLDPNGGAEPIPVPPSGFVAGLYAQTDKRRGVWKSPAGTQVLVGGAVGLVTELTDVQQGGLNTHPKSVSVIRRFTSSGTVLWGARTMSSDPEWRYTAVRRVAIFLRVSIFNGIQWAVFEPNDEPLWAQLRLNLNAFMMSLYRQEAFQGSTPAAAFFVKVDSETTSQIDIDNGIVNILVGFAPLKPAEFVVVKISQKAGESG